MFNVPLIEAPLNGSEIREHLVQIVDMYYEGKEEEALRLFHELTIARTNELTTDLCTQHDFSDNENSVAQLAMVGAQEHLVRHARILLRQIARTTRLGPLEQRAWALSEMLVIFIDLPKILEELISEDTTELHELINSSE